MKINDTIMGFAEYEGVKCPFICENGILQLMPASVDDLCKRKKELWNSFSKSYNSDNDKAKYLTIKAETSDEKNIFFCVYNNSSNNNGFISFQILYLYMYIPKLGDENNIYSFSVTGREINDFYSPFNIFDFDGMNITYKHDNDYMLGEYLYNDVNIQMNFEVSTTLHIGSYEPLAAQIGIRFIYSEPKDISFTIEIFKHCQNFFFYICNRTNILFNDLEIYNDNNESVGIIRLFSNNQKSESDIDRKERIIKYEYIKGNIGSLFADFASGKMYLEHLCSSIDSTNVYHINRIILNFVAFEREFYNLYKDMYAPSQEQLEVKENVLNCLSGLKGKYTGKRKEKLKSIVRMIERADLSYGDKFQKALCECKDILIPFMIHDYGKYSNKMFREISQRINKLRNDLVHGNLNCKIESEHLADLLTIENLLYAMRLKALGVNQSNIQKSIKALKRYNIIIKQ